MDFMSILRMVSIAGAAVQTVSSVLSNEQMATSIKALMPPDILGQVEDYASKAFAAVQPALRAVAAIQTIISPDKNKTIQGGLNVAAQALGVTLPPLVVDGDYGPKTREMAMAVQKALVEKLGIKLAVDGWWGQLSAAALQIFMQGAK